VKKCVKPQKVVPTTFPDVELGDVVKYVKKGEPYHNSCYLVVANPKVSIAGGDEDRRLVNLETGCFWSISSQWGSSTPDCWVLIDCYFSEGKCDG